MNEDNRRAVAIVPSPSQTDTFQSSMTLHALLFATLGLGIAGLGAELLLLEHFEEWRQWLPLALLAAAALVWLLHVWRRAASTVIAMRVVMALHVAVGAVGVWFHYQGNTEFELEMYPAMAGWELFKESMMGATPALAPGALVQLGLLGLAWSFRHPALLARGKNDTPLTT